MRIDYTPRLLGRAAFAFLTLALASCNGQRQSALEGPESAPPPFPSEFTPSPPLADPDPAPSDKLGLAYLQKIYAEVGGPWAAFLENCRLRLPPSHELNNQTLEARVSMAIGRDGSLQAASLAQGSGQAEYDEVVLAIIRDAAPFPEPSSDAVSDDDAAHVMWLFARDRRQAGPATAELRRVEWQPQRAVPKYIADGDLTTAARRLAGAAGQPGADDKVFLGLGRQLAEAVMREALRQEDGNVQRIGVAGAASAKLLAAAPELREIIGSSVDVALRGEAIAALGAIGDEGASSLLLEVMETAKGSGVGGTADNSAAAARALAAMGKGEIAESTVLGWLQAPDKASQWAALVVMGEFPVPSATPILAGLIKDRSQPRERRIAACTALGTSATPGSSAVSMLALRRSFSQSDAGLRAACVAAVARATRAKVRSRMTYWALVGLLKKERDERVRAAAVSAAAGLEPGRFHKELYLFRAEKSPLVLAALARALGGTTAPAAVNKLIELTRATDPEVRRNAAASLLARKESSAHKALAALSADSDPEVRLAAVHALDDVEALTGLLTDPSPAVRSAAFGSIVRLRGQRATLAQLAQAIAQSPPSGPDRALWAKSWLTSGR